MAYRTLKTIPLIDILPSSIAGDEKIKAAAAALDDELAAVNTGISRVRGLWNLETADPELLKVMAWGAHVDFWDDGFSEEQKRTIVRLSLPLHLKRGTPGAIEQILKDILGGGVVEEWHEYGGRPFHFRVVSNAGAGDEKMDRQLRAAIEWAKNARSVLDAIIKAPSLLATRYIGGTSSVGVVHNFYQEG